MNDTRLLQIRSLATEAEKLAKELVDEMDLEPFGRVDVDLRRIIVQQQSTLSALKRLEEL